MRRWLVLAIACLLTSPLLAVSLRHGGNVIIEQGQTVNDDLVVSGGTLQILGNVTNDLVIAGGTVEVSGTIGGDVIAAGGNVTIRGPVGGSIYIAGGNVTLQGTVGRNVIAAGGTLIGNQGMTAGRDLVASGGTVTFSGTVTRDLIGAGGDFTVTDRAHIGRNLLLQSGNPHVAAGAVIGGEKIIKQPAHRRGARHAGVVLWFLWPLLTGVALLLTGLLVVALAPRLTDETVWMVRRHPWGSLLAGFIILVAVPIIAFILLFFIVTIPISLILSALYLIGDYLAPIFVLIWVGQLILRRREGSAMLALLIGVVLWIIVRWIPILGGLVSFILLLLGLGALVLAIQGRMRNPIFREEEQRVEV